jgi:glycosyltransferase involved in cell wall biosynthesis
MRVQIVDPPAFTPPYDRSLCAALARAGADVELVTSPFRHGPVPPAVGYEVSEHFHRRSAKASGEGPLRRPLKLLEHARDMAAHRRGANAADVVHYQWLPVPALDSRLLSPIRPRLLTAHGLLRREAWRGRPGGSLRRVLERMDAVIALSAYGARRLTDEAGLAPERVRVIPHGALDYLTHLDPAPLPAELEGAEGPVILCFGLVRPYKGVDVLLEAFRDVGNAQLWVVGRPLGVDLDAMRALGDRATGPVRFVPRFVPDDVAAACFRRADVVVLPHRDAEQSGVLFAALAFGKAMVMSAVGGFPEVAAHGAGRLVPAGEPEPLAAALRELAADGAAREALARGSRRAAAGPYSWDAVAAQTLALYGELLEAGSPE